MQMHLQPYTLLVQGVWKTRVLSLTQSTATRPFRQYQVREQRVDDRGYSDEQQLGVEGFLQDHIGPLQHCALSLVPGLRPVLPVQGRDHPPLHQQRLE